MTSHRATTRGARPPIGVLAGVRYGALAAALSFVALPLYVVLPGHYAGNFGVSLAALGGILLSARALDALVDPWLGRWIDRALSRSRRDSLRLAAAAAAVLLLGFLALFFPPRLTAAGLLVWCAATLVVTYLGYSTLAVLHQAWGTRIGGDAATRARVASWREGLALAGVLLASVMPGWLGLGATGFALALLLVAGLGALTQAPFRAGVALVGTVDDWRLPLRTAEFRALLALYMANGVASAIPATLVLFFIRDRLQAGSHEGLLLGLYFAAAAASFPLWLRWIARFGLRSGWLAGMALAIVSFAGAAWLGAGDVAAFAAVCVGSGVALGADLAAPSALLTGVIQRAGHGQLHEGRYVGWWTAATKLNLALAAGLVLPVLDRLGYRPGTQDADALQALTWAYCLLPCMLKALAAWGLWRWRGPQAGQE
jgi:glycoside/pentoside/hexuronide:cation symporter, GPH family